MNRPAFRFVFVFEVFFGLFLFAGCGTTEPSGIQQVRVDQAAKIAAEPPGDYFIGHRYFKGSVFKFWGYVRKPGQPWNTAKLVVFNEKEKLAPDREKLSFGSDNNYEYKLWGAFSGQTVYEPASNGFYPEFVLKKYELISTNPPPIFKSQMQGRPTPTELRYTVEKPE